MVIIDRLKEEHQAILLMLQVLEAVCKKLEIGEDVNKDDLYKMVDFIKIYADKSHHHKEEDLLFPAMVEAGIPKEGGPIGVMLAEHTMGRNFVQGMNQALEEFSTGSADSSSKIVSNARGYVELLTDHIYKEDNILYPMAEMHISDEKHSELLKEFEQVEPDKIGEEKHNEMVDNLNELKEIYLS